MISKQPFNEVLQDWVETFMHRSMRDFRRWMDDYGLSMSQINVLMRLYHHDVAGVSDIGTYLGVTNAASSQLIDRLVQMRLLERTEDPVDRRAKQIRITEEGRSLVERSIRARLDWMKELTGSLTPDQQLQIAESLTLLAKAARQLDPQN
jgi:DNA-binding MarR family transcriptional regulator